MIRWLIAALLVCGAASCATVRGGEPEVIETEAGVIRLDFVEWNEETSELLRTAAPEAAKALSRWGGLREQVRITVVNSHWELEELVGRPLPGISAWARRNQVILWDPRWWPLPPGIQENPALAARLRRTQVTGLLKHELTHSLMFQRAGGPPSDPRNRIPFWFREGMATVTAGEGAQWPPPESLSQWLAKHPGVDLLRDAPQLVRTDPAIAYGAAYHAFDFLVRRYGDATVLQVVDGMRVRDRFPDAFRDALGVNIESFATDFRRYLGWRGFLPAGPRTD
ncbi:MAG: hypothetical protein EHM78_16635 [Myxococcaceae bacterium]|nr:MAG: hypothetical protein EHM78_16635 [Myxococcaceae bacterium]